MKLKFNHNKEGVMEALGVSRDRMDVIVGNAQRALKTKYESGTKSQLLDYMLRECEDVPEAVATAIVWDTITTQMEKMAFLKKEAKEQKSQEFANRMKINR